MNGVVCQRPLVPYCNICAKFHSQFSHFIHVYKEGLGIKYKTLVTCVICGSLVYSWSCWEGTTSPNIDITKCDISYHFDTNVNSSKIVNNLNHNA